MRLMATAVDRHAAGPRSTRPVGVLQVVLTLGAGGTERLVVEICRRLQSRFEMAVCTLDEPGTWAAELKDRGIPVTSIHRRPGFHPSIGWRVAQAARRANAAVLHCHHYSPFVYGTIARSLLPGVRMAFTEHGRLSDGPPSAKRRLVNPVLGRLGGPMFAVSHALRDSMVAEGFPSNRITVVHNGIEVGARPSTSDRCAARRRLHLPPGHLVVGTIARLNPVKDLGTLIGAFAEVRRTTPHAALVIIGEGEERPHLEQAVRAAGIAPDVRFLGERDDARTLLHGFDIFANSSTSEGVSLTILEAMAAELPVVATRVGGTPEVIDDELTGVLVPARRPEALARAVAILAADPARRRALGARARAAVEQCFTIDCMVEHYAQVYLRLAS